MSNPINTAPLQLFIQQVKSAEMSNQREIRIDIQKAKQLAFALGEIQAKMLQDYDQLLNKLMQTTGQAVTISMDGGNL